MFVHFQILNLEQHTLGSSLKVKYYIITYEEIFEISCNNLTYNLHLE